MTDPVAAWHAFVEHREPALLDALLADDVTFHSPVVHRPQPGKRLTAGYLLAAMQVLGNPSFRYVREIVGKQDAALEFSVTIDGTEINGVDLMRWNEQGLITDFKVMLRPLKAVNLVHKMMGNMLQKMK